MNLIHKAPHNLPKLSLTLCGTRDDHPTLYNLSIVSAATQPCSVDPMRCTTLWKLRIYQEQRNGHDAAPSREKDLSRWSFLLPNPDHACFTPAVCRADFSKTNQSCLSLNI